MVTDTVIFDKSANYVCYCYHGNKTPTEICA